MASDYERLIYDVFHNNPNGKKLLAAWNEELTSTMSVDRSHEALAYTAGHNDFIVQINSIIAKVGNDE
jgi:hypothetical protein